MAFARLLAVALAVAGCGPAALPAVEDHTPPTVRIVSPADGAKVEGDGALMEVEYADEGSGVSTSGFRAWLDGEDLSGAFDQHSRGATARLGKALGLGEHRLVVEVADRAGHRARAESSFLSPGSGWLVLDARLPPVGSAVSALALSADGRRLAVGEANGTIAVWDVDAGRVSPAGVFRGHRRDVLGLAFTPDGRALVSGGADRTVRHWALPPAAGRPPSVLAGHRFRVTSVAVSPDGRTAASASFDGTVRLWDLSGAAPRERASLAGHLGPVHAVAFSPDGRALASVAADETLHLWALDGETPRAARTLAGGAPGVRRLAFASGRPRLAMAGLDDAIRVVDRSLERAPAALAGHQAPVQALAFAGGTARLVSIDARGRVIVWDGTEGTKIAERAVEARLSSAAFSPDGAVLAAASANGRVYLCRVTAGSAAAR